MADTLIDTPVFDNSGLHIWMWGKWCVNQAEALCNGQII